VASACGTLTAPLPDIDFTQILLSFAVLVISLTVHEAAHAWSANYFGDPTARLLGRVSLNPAVHIDPIGTIVFPLLAMVTGLNFLIGWAKPVPVNTRQLGPHWKQRFMLIAAAGPASNLVMATVAAVAIRLLIPNDSIFESTLSPTVKVLFQAVQLNVLLAVFNMVPVPPLDGGNVLAGVLRGPAAEAFERLRPYGFMVIYGLMLSGILWRLVSPVEELVLSLLL